MRTINEDQWRIYQDKENAWHWKKTAPAGQILGSQPEAMTAEQNVWKMPENMAI